MLSELSIRTKSTKTKRLNKDDSFAWAQRELVAEIERQYNAGKPVRIIVLKGRQLGCSTVSEAVLFLWAFLHPGAYSLVLSKEKEDSQYLYDMTKRYWDLGPFSKIYETRYNTKEHLVLEGLDSTIRVATASKDEVGRGNTIHACHCSEVSRWGDRTDTIIPGLSKAVPYTHGTIWILESTANGVGGYFYDTWQEAVAGESEFIPMFFPWFLHNEYEVERHQLTYSNLDDEEREIVELMLTEGVDPVRVLAKLAWRRKEIKRTPRGLSGFHEEFPCTPDEAFLSTGSNLFTLEELEAVYKPAGSTKGLLYNDDGKLAFAEAENGHLTVYKFPTARQKYAVALDPSQTIEGDPCCVQVINRATLEQVAVWHGSADPATIGQIALMIAHWYNEALLNTEIQGGGQKVIDVWRAAGYRNLWMDRRPDKARKSTTTFCWSTTHATKAWLLGTLQDAIRRKRIILHHYPTFYELSQYVCLEDGTYGPARRSGHDDTVMALGICLVTAITEAHGLDLASVMGQGQGDLSPAGRRLTIPGQGNPVTTIGPWNMGGQDELASIYAGPGEIEEWAGWD
jgi:hypothetical protein